MAHDNLWIQRYREMVTGYIQALDGLNALRAQWDSLDYGNTLTEEDFAAQPDINLPQVTAAVASIEALYGVFLQGHSTNLYALKL